MTHERGGKGNDNIGNDIGHADVAGFLHLLEKISFLHSDDCVHMIMGDIFRGDANRVRIDIHRQHMTGAKQGGGNGQTSAATLTTGEKGKLVSANNDLMFAVVEFTDAAMKELLGPNRDGALPMLELDIKRKGYDGPAGERVGRIRLRVAVEDKNYVIADILGEWEQVPAEVGDVVFMD